MIGQEHGPRRVARVRLDAGVISEMITTGYEVERVRCVEGVPSDATLIGSFNDPAKGACYLVFSHDSFPETTLGEEIPELDVVTTVESQKTVRMNISAARVVKELVKPATTPSQPKPAPQPEKVPTEPSSALPQDVYPPARTRGGVSALIERAVRAFPGVFTSREILDRVHAIPGSDDITLNQVCAAISWLKGRGEITCVGLTEDKYPINIYRFGLVDPSERTPGPTGKKKASGVPSRTRRRAGRKKKTSASRGKKR